VLKRVFEFSFLSGGRKNEKIVRLFLRSFVVREKKNLPGATFRKQIAVFWAPNISFLPAAHGFITSHALLRYYYCRHNNKKKEKQESKKGPKERERETLGESYVVHRHHLYPFSSSRAKKKSIQKKSIYLNLR